MLSTEGVMSSTNLNFSNSVSFAPRTSRQGISNNAGLSASSSDIITSEDTLVSIPDHTQLKLQSMNGSSPSHSVNTRDADDKIIAAWFKLMKPNPEDNSSSVKNSSKEDDPGRVPDPLYEPTKATVPDSLKIITFNDLMRAFAPKKPHWKHYDDASNQFQVGSQERD